jgi:hypothetical protein
MPIELNPAESSARTALPEANPIGGRPAGLERDLSFVVRLRDDISSVRRPLAGASRIIVREFGGLPDQDGNNAEPTAPRLAASPSDRSPLPDGVDVGVRLTSLTQ